MPAPEEPKQSAPEEVKEEAPKKEPKKPDQTPAAKTDAKDKDKKSNASGVKAKEPAKAAPVVSASPTKA